MVVNVRLPDGTIRPLYDVRPNAYNRGDLLELVFGLLDEAVNSEIDVFRNKNPKPVNSITYPYLTFEVDNSKVDDNEHGTMVNVDCELFDRGTTSDAIDKYTDMLNNELDHKRHMYENYWVKTELERDRDIPDETDKELLRRMVALTFYIERNDS